MDATPRYIEWHSLDHRPEQYRLPQLRGSLRVASTPACRKARAASTPAYDAVDHVMTYLFTGPDGIPGFTALGGALAEGGRTPRRLPSIGYMTADLAGKQAAPYAVAGADVIPWRPALGIYLIIERGHSSPTSLLDVPGVAGVWWYHGAKAPAPYDVDARDLQVTYCYLDADPVQIAEKLAVKMRERWASGDIEGLLAAPYYTIVPYEWDRYLPSEK